MGCTSENCVPLSSKNNPHTILESSGFSQIEDLPDKRSIKHYVNLENDEENFYHYKEKDLILLNEGKMTIKRIEDF